MIKLQIPKYELGNFVGPTILTDVTEDMDCYKVYSTLAEDISVSRVEG